MAATSDDQAAAPRTDRRQRKSRGALQAALLELLDTSPYATITVEDLVEAGDVARATFYAHYQDKDALLSAVVEDSLRELTNRVEPLAALPQGFYDGRALLEVVWHALDHPALYRTVLSGAGGAPPRRRMVEDLSAAVQRTFVRTQEQVGGTPLVPLELVARCLVAQLLALVEDLVTGPSRGSGDGSTALATPPMDDGAVVEAVAATAAIAARGVTWALGLAGEQLRDETGNLKDYARLRRGGAP